MRRVKWSRAWRRCLPERERERLRTVPRREAFKGHTDSRTRHILRMNGELLIGCEGFVQKIQRLVQYRGTDVDELFQIRHLIFRGRGMRAVLFRLNDRRMTGG